MKRNIRTALLLLALPAASLAVYESWRVAVARVNTPALITDALKHADPQVFRISKTRIDMLLAVEDPTFWTNDGTDFTSHGAGATTLTQGLGKQIYFPDGFAPGFRKLELILDAKYALTKLASKEDILHAFLARAWMGRDARGSTVYGFADAARRFHGKELPALSDDEFLSLVALLYAPAEMNPLRQPAANAERVARIKKLLTKRCTPSGVTDVTLEGCAGS
jgi:membrane carboxypeptidase/penicillin-binding protein